MAHRTTLTAAAQPAIALVEEIKRQSQPRRFFWQEKTVRDLLSEGRADLIERAVTRTADLTSAAAAQRDQLAATIQQQSQPRRFFWQAPTAYDKLSAQRARIADAAIERAAALSEQANERRQFLLDQARRQAQSRRFFWQPLTLRDKLEQQRDALAAQVKPSRRWQPPTLHDKLLAQRDDLRGTLNERLPIVQGAAEEALSRASETARRTGQTIAATPQRIGTLASSTADSLIDSGQSLVQRVGGSAESAASSVKAAAMVPVEAVAGGVAASRRGVRRGVRLFRALMWGILIGMAIGVILAPRAGQETRRNLQDLWNRMMDLVPASS